MDAARGATGMAVLVGAVEVIVEPATVGAGRVTPGRIAVGFMTAEVVPSGLFGCLDLPPFAEPGEELREALIECGRPGGMMDALDPLEVGPVRLITEPELSPNNRDNPTHTAGVTFFGQFLDHDITRDAGSGLGRPTPVRRSMNLRSARMDLDSVYSGGPGDSPALYDGFRFRI